ncbi:hypothetical protein [Acidovorax sp. SUPP3334]|uniref:hypothetical protein n=1 Tax=Acidovorax sp. SUPP3334 TaxID=2920881 RepID=UPI0023DE5EAE|nr:hypothetical protein [Acidovorax sp. SUPP3334]GKT23379.1 hypothetical protein AVHM3334_11415 [Acidovorax sp. SUPP3334]
MIHFSVVVLSSLIMGLLLTPTIYIAMGALGGFATAFTFISLPLLLACTLFLLCRFLAKPGSTATPRQWLAGLESIAWLGVVFFLFIVSGFTLLTHAERVGLFCTLLLIASFLAAPWMALRPSMLAARIARWPARWVSASSLIAPVVLIVGSAMYLHTPEHFL